MKTHIEYPVIFFRKYNSPYHIEIGTYVLIDLLRAWLCCTRPTDLPPMKLRNFCPNMFHMSRWTTQERFIWRSSLQGDRQGLRVPNTFPMQFKGYNSCYRIQNREFSVMLEQGHRILPCRNENSYRVPRYIFLKNNCPYHNEMGTYVLIDSL